MISSFDMINLSDISTSWKVFRFPGLRYIRNQILLGIFRTCQMQLALEDFLVEICLLEEFFGSRRGTRK